MKKKEKEKNIAEKEERKLKKQEQYILKRIQKHCLETLVGVVFLQTNSDGKMDGLYLE